MSVFGIGEVLFDLSGIIRKLHPDPATRERNHREMVLLQQILEFRGIGNLFQDSRPQLNAGEAQRRNLLYSLAVIACPSDRCITKLYVSCGGSDRFIKIR